MEMEWRNVSLECASNIKLGNFPFSLFLSNIKIVFFFLNHSKSLIAIFFSSGWKFFNIPSRMKIRFNKLRMYENEGYFAPELWKFFEI